MLFFSPGLAEFNKGYGIIFRMADPEEEEGPQDAGNVETVTDADKTYNMMSLIHIYSDFTHIDWDRVWDKGIVEFFNTLAFITEYKKREVSKNRPATN